MATRIKMTPYESIPTYTKSLSLYSVKDMKHMDDLIEAMRAWNLHGSANRLESWRAKMQTHIEKEHEEYEWNIRD